MELDETKKEEFRGLFQDFASSYSSSPDGESHISKYEVGRQEACKNYEQIVAAADRGEDVVDRILLQLLPYSDSASNRQAGAWIHVAPTIEGDLKGWFENVGWISPDRWPDTARALLSFVRRCVEHPDELAHACSEWAQSPCSKGFQTGMITPILNALQPDRFLVINNKSRTAINYFAGTSHKQTIADYPATNTTGKELISALAPEMKDAAIPDIRQSDLFDMFTHWLVAVKKYFPRENHPPPGTAYWKIAPGDNAWNWSACRDGGFIAIGWDELGDLSTMNRQDFNAKRDDLVAAHDDWTKEGTEQAWKFAHINVGDRIVANHGKSKVLGIGTVTGPYSFADAPRHRHRLPVRWDDLAERRIKKGGWSRTLVKLTAEDFEQICKAPLISGGAADPTCPFSSTTFDLLAALHTNPRREEYLSRKEDFRVHVEEPLQGLLERVAKALPKPITDEMETERQVFSRILKNDWGRGGAWDFYWGAFYPKAGKRQTDAQLFVVVQPDAFGYGFAIGQYAAEQGRRFLRNCSESGPALSGLLGEGLEGENYLYTSRDEDANKAKRSLDKWLADFPKKDPVVKVVLPIASVLGCSADRLVERVAAAFCQLFPFVLIATSDKPVDAVAQYFEAVSPEPPPKNPPYSVADIEKDTGFASQLLMGWIRSLERKGQAVVYGPPGTGKTYLAERIARHLISETDGFSELVQFHPSYAYEDFMQGIRPQTRPEGGLEYPMVPGRFREFCRKAKARQGTCVLIVDEINRANLARVFGELMYLLEYRSRQVPLSGGGMFEIPPNVRLIGTMNTADRSIALVDHALRRRFAFLPLRPHYEVLERYHATTGFNVQPLIVLLKRLNTQINDHNYEIGVSFFLRQDLAGELPDVWQTEIDPYLEEYFYDQPARLDEFRWDRVGSSVLP